MLESQVFLLSQRIEMKNNEVSSLQSRISASQGQATVLEREMVRLEQLKIEVLGVYFSQKGGCEQQS